MIGNSVEVHWQVHGPPSVQQLGEDAALHTVLYVEAVWAMIVAACLRRPCMPAQLQRCYHNTQRLRGDVASSPVGWVAIALQGCCF
jgi:hypothetical protein